MTKPEQATIEIKWLDDKGQPHYELYDQDDLESAITLLQLMNGDVCEEDLKP